MPTNLLTTGSIIDELSAELTVIAGTPVGLGLKGAAGLARVIVLKKDDGGAMQPTAVQLTNANPDGTLVAPGVYRVQRKKGTCGVFYD